MGFAQVFEKIIIQKKMIPKILHYCWFGRNVKPIQFYNYLETWKKCLPDYEIIEWNEDNFDLAMTEYSLEAYRTGNYAHVSDVCRVYALYKYGGVYVDTDVELLKGFEPFLKLNAFVGSEHTLVGTGVIGSRPCQKWLEVFLNYYRQTHFINVWGHAVRTPNTKILTRRILPDLPVNEWPTIFPDDFFCGKDCVTGKTNITDNTVSVHHFAASWRRKKSFKQRVMAIIYGITARYFGK